MKLKTKKNKKYCNYLRMPKILLQGSCVLKSEVWAFFPNSCRKFTCYFFLFLSLSLLHFEFFNKRGKKNTLTIPWNISFPKTQWRNFKKIKWHLGTKINDMKFRNKIMHPLSHKGFLFYFLRIFKPSLFTTYLILMLKKSSYQCPVLQQIGSANLKERRSVTSGR